MYAIFMLPGGKMEYCEVTEEVYKAMEADRSSNAVKTYNTLPVGEKTVDWSSVVELKSSDSPPGAPSVNPPDATFDRDFLNSKEPW
jgi:hypothetical protein